MLCFIPNQRMEHRLKTLNANRDCSKVYGEYYPCLIIEDVLASFNFLIKCVVYLIIKSWFLFYLIILNQKTNSYESYTHAFA